MPIPTSSNITKSKPPSTFFAPRSQRSVPRLDYTQLQRKEVVPTNPLRPASTPTTSTIYDEDDPMDVDPLAPLSDNEDGDTIEVEAPVFAEEGLTDEEKLDAVRKWKIHREKNERKPRDMTSHVYYYMRRRLLPGVLFADKVGPKCYQDYRWTCNLCYGPNADPLFVHKKYQVLENKRKGVTSGMGDHLKLHGITKEIHNARQAGYFKEPHSNPDTTWSGNVDLITARLQPKEAMRRWFVKSRQAFLVVESPEFQEMFYSVGSASPYRSRLTLRNSIFDDFLMRRAGLSQELEFNCTTISLTLDMWTAPNRKPIFAIIGHWMTAEFEEREEVLEFMEVQGSHTGENLAIIVERLLTELKLKQKLFTITGDNAGNNGTLCKALFKSLAKHFDDKYTKFSIKPRMRFHGEASWIRCFAHVIALICGDVLKDLKAGTANVAKEMLDNWEKEYSNVNFDIPIDDSRSSIAKVRLLNLWILRSTPREQDWADMPKTINRRPIYDVDTRWNAMYDMIVQYLDLFDEYEAFIDAHPYVKNLKITDDEKLSLYQLAFVLKPFKDMTLKVSQAMPSIVRSLENYWDLDELLDKVTTGSGIYSDLDQSVRKAFANGRRKYVKYADKLKGNAILYAAHILDPRCRVSLINDMMTEEAAEEAIQQATEFFHIEWPGTAILDTSTLMTTLSDEPQERPIDVSLAQWKAQQRKKAKDDEAKRLQPSSELERWIAMDPLEYTTESSKDPDWLRKWWRDNHQDWPELAKAMRDLLPCSASEVDVERLFSGCKDEIGIRRHALKSTTVRVLTLLRSSYRSQDKEDEVLLANARKLNVWDMRNSILWRPDEICERLDDPAGKSITFISRL